MKCLFTSNDVINRPLAEPFVVGVADFQPWFCLRECHRGDVLTAPNLKEQGTVYAGDILSYRVPGTQIQLTPNSMFQFRSSFMKFVQFHRTKTS